MKLARHGAVHIRLKRIREAKIEPVEEKPNQKRKIENRIYEMRRIFTKLTSLIPKQGNRTKNKILTTARKACNQRRRNEEYLGRVE
jgi:hypothetical protein